MSLLRAGAIYGVTAVVCGTAFIALALRLVRSSEADRRPAHRLFAFSIPYLFALFAALLAGRLHVYVACDWGEEIDLDLARQRGAGVVLDMMRRSRTPASIAYRPPPLRFTLRPVSVEMPGLTTVPPDSGNAGPTGLPSSRNWTSPVGVEPLGSELLTVAVKFNELPYVGELELETRVTVAISEPGATTVIVPEAKVIL